MEKSRWASRDATNLSFERDRAFGFSWPQRNYKCSFCKKEFKSAQALGGHMNVHRRDRARLRFSPSWEFPNPNPNPNPNPSLSLSSSSQLPSSAKFPPCLQGEDEVPTIDHCSSPRKITTLLREDLGEKSEGRGLEFNNFTRRNDANELIRLDLSLGLTRDVKEDLDLDLELRLGCS